MLSHSLLTACLFQRNHFQNLASRNVRCSWLMASSRKPETLAAALELKAVLLPGDDLKGGECGQNGIGVSSWQARTDVHWCHGRGSRSSISLGRRDVATAAVLLPAETSGAHQQRSKAQAQTATTHAEGDRLILQDEANDPSGMGACMADAASTPAS